MGEVAKALENALLAWEKGGSREVRRKRFLDRVGEAVVSRLCCVGCLAAQRDDESDDRPLVAPQPGTNML